MPVELIDGPQELPLCSKEAGVAGACADRSGRHRQPGDQPMRTPGNVTRSTGPPVLPLVAETRAGPGLPPGPAECARPRGRSTGAAAVAGGGGGVQGSAHVSVLDGEADRTAGAARDVPGQSSAQTTQSKVAMRIRRHHAVQGAPLQRTRILYVLYILRERLRRDDRTTPVGRLCMWPAKRSCLKRGDGAWGGAGPSEGVQLGLRIGLHPPAIWTG
jgi:hypothetical protein